MQRLQAVPDPWQRRYALDRARRSGARWLSKASNQIMPLVDQLSVRELDLLIGCMARLEHAIAYEPKPFRRLKSAALKRL